MANIKISGLPFPFALKAASALTGAEVIPMDQVVGGVLTTVGGTAAAIAALGGSSGTPSAPLNSPAYELLALEMSIEDQWPAIMPTVYPGNILTLSGFLQLPRCPMTAATTRAMTGLVGLRSAVNNITSSTALTADASLQVTFNETGTYAISGYLAFFEVTLGTGGFQFDLGAGTATTSSINWAADGFITALTGNPAATSTTTAQSYSTVSTSSTAPSFVDISGSVTISVTGTFGVRVAQVVSSANTTTVQAGSYIQFTKIA